jgi:glycosyltransferase involved in cell wall biosynthesis
VICFPIIDWDFRFQRPQQLMSQFALAGHRVFYVKQDFREYGPSYDITIKVENVFEVSLRGPDRNVYGDSLTDHDVSELLAGLAELRRDLSLGATAIVVQLPFWRPLVEAARKEFSWPITYDCMDYHAGFSTNRPTMLEEERHLVACADCVIVSSPFLEREVGGRAKNMLLVRNGCDYDHFARVGTHSVEDVPTIGYYGAIADWFDTDLVLELARKRPDWRFLLVGSTFSADLGKLKMYGNISLVGEQPYAELPHWIEKMDVLILPFKRSALTEATNPVKAYEILAAGKPLVSVPIEEMVGLHGLVELASNADEFRSCDYETDGRERVIDDRNQTRLCERAYLARAIRNSSNRVARDLSAGVSDHRYLWQPRAQSDLSAEFVYQH